MARRNHGYVIYKKYEIGDIFKELENNELPDKLIYGESDYKDSLRRVQIIKDLINRDGSKCMNCEAEPKYFALGKDKMGRWHMDLYGGEIDDDHMFTIDHVHPKSKGGTNTMENYQLLCKICNEDKSDSVNGEESSQKINVKRLYIDKKLTSLSEQLKGVLNKIKNKDIICIREHDGFTVGKQYEILDIRMKVYKRFESKYHFVTINDKGERVETVFDNFITKIDYIHVKKQL
jgi:5-methylcytosine-specific restriction endonuclease McrA